MAFLAHVVLLVQGPPDALAGPPLYLPLNIAGVNGGADILKSGAAEDIHLTRFRVHLDVDDVRRVGRARPGRVHVGPSHHGAAGLDQPRCDLLEAQPELGVRPVPELAVDVFHLVLIHLPEDGGPLDQLALHVPGSFVGGYPRFEGHAAPSRKGGEAYGIGVPHDGVHVFDRYAQDLGQLLGDGHTAAPDIDRPLHQVDGAV